MAIQRINYHYGLFLEEDEFKLEQNYHMLMRRRINYVLFTPGMLYGLTLSYDGNNLSINPGLAIDESTNPDTGEPIGREIVVPSLYPATTELGSLSGTVYITISYKEHPTHEKAPTGIASRITEDFEIQASNDDPGILGKDRILLGNIKIGQSGTNEPVQRVSLRLGGAVPVPAPTIANINPGSGIQGSSLTDVEITGDNFTGPTSVIFDPDDGLSFSNFTVVDDEHITFDLDIALTASATNRKFRITTPGGTARSEDFGVSFTVNTAAILQSITVSANQISIPESVGTAQFTAMGHYNSGPDQDITNQVTWKSSDNSVATIDSTGLATGGSAGTADITSTLNGVTSNTVSLVVGLPVIVPWLNDQDRRRHGTETLTILGERFAEPLQVAFRNATGGDPVIVLGTVNSLTEAEVVVPGPYTPTPADPPVVRSGNIRVITTAGESNSSPQAFILVTT